MTNPAYLESIRALVAKRSDATAPLLISEKLTALPPAPDWYRSMPSELFSALRNIGVSFHGQTSLEEATTEARYLVECFTESGHTLCEALTSRHGTEAKDAKKELSALKKWLRTYATK